MESIKKLKPEEVEVGMSVPWPIYDIERAILLKQGLVISSERQLNFILSKGVYRGVTEEEVIEEKKRKEIELRKIQSDKLKNPFEMKRACANKLESLMQKLIKKEQVNAQESIAELVKLIKISCEYNANATLAAVHLSDEFGYGILHPLHTAILCKLLMSRLSFSDSQQQTVMAAALVMNVGMYELQEQLFTQAEALTEEQGKAIHDHPELSVSILKTAGVDDSHMLNIILQHHERIDGAGYPAKLLGEKIHQGAKVVALSDMYSAMITPRAYREPIMAHDALKDIFTGRGKSVDDHLTQLLIREVGLYPPGSFVTLVNGDTAIVLKRAIVKKGGKATAPIVACIVSPRGGLYEKPPVRDANMEEYKIASMAQPSFDEPVSFSYLWGAK